MTNALPDPDYHAEFYADVPLKRLIAWLVDTLLIVLLTVLVLPFTAFTGLFYFPFLAMMVGFVYRVLSVAGASATPGMRLMAIELRNARGERLDLPQAALHTLLFTVFFSMMLPQVASLALMLTGPRAQGLHDLMLGTAAINRPAAV
ncbi:RDD family protein [Actibacterium sp. MT2.3-13A]|uniref:RDD family protein n=1 Tax=Actibacterium sp. MT2.3-13A TaxID=2828332 RepID=UPI001BA86BE4|nr:RDD family protein [Actibacterium sp. MT2.3-13A]